MKDRTGEPFKLGLDALQAIARIWNPSRKYLLPFPYDQGVLYDQFHRIREAAGLPPSSSNNGCLHLLRRSVATETAKHLGVEAAQRLLGHSTPQLTKKNYIDQTKLPARDFTSVLRPLGRSA
jgi:integrase